MAEINPVDEAPTKSIKDVTVGAFDKIKGPVFWLALGYAICKFTDRKIPLKM